MCRFSASFNPFGELATSVDKVRPLDPLLLTIGKHEFVWPIPKGAVPVDTENSIRIENAGFGSVREINPTQQVPACNIVSSRLLARLNLRVLATDKSDCSACCVLVTARLHHPGGLRRASGYFS